MGRLICLYATSITCGFCMMALEILGARVLQPFFGSGIDVWAAIISVFILSLSIGYWMGGRIADKATNNRPLAIVIIIAAICYLLLPIWARPALEAMGPEVHTARGGVLFAALVLFLPPSLLLGCISPMLVKLVFVGAERVGRSTGTLYAVGSFGNVMGILATDYILLVSFDLNPNIQGMGIVMGLLGIAHLLIPIAGTSERKIDPQTLVEAAP
ncbi:MAG: hypothetical protein EA402_07160 [Planctomycetota bacterium]|nr:MAG: hypothetical protein EA402_07160 [Planctomycetota bacterium]